MNIRTMFSYNNLPFFMDADKEGAGGTSDNDGGTSDNTDASTGADNNGDSGSKEGEVDIQALIAKAVEEAVAPLAKKNKELLDEKKTLQTKMKTTPTLSDEEYKNYQELKARLEKDEIAKLIAEGKSEEAFDRLTKRTKAELEAKLTAEAEAREAAERRAAERESEVNNMRISAAITKASTSVKPEYIGVIDTMISSQIKVIDGEVRVVDSNGEVVVGRGGKPLAVEDVIETLRPKYPDLFLPSSGGGAGGSGGKQNGGSGGKLSMDVIAQMTPDEYRKARREGRI